MSENKIVKYMFYVGVFTVTMIYYIFAAFVLEKAFFENIEYISMCNTFEEVIMPHLASSFTIVDSIAIIAVFVMFFVILYAAFRTGKRLLKVWGGKERLITVLCFLASFFTVDILYDIIEMINNY